MGDMDGLKKASTGINGFDQITFGGLPEGRTTLVCGGAGSGKTLFALEFLARGAAEFDEPGVFMSFEESKKELIDNTASLEIDLPGLNEAGKVYIDHVRIDRTEVSESGQYDLEGLFIRLGNAVDTVGARRVVLDSLEALFSELSNRMILRSELQRLFLWLKERDLTTVITGERGEKTMTRYGLEEYISDCVIFLDHRVKDQISTRRMKIVKYRGSKHGTNEFPFIINSAGIDVIPVTEVGLDHPGYTEKVLSGIPELNSLLGGDGFFKGSSIIVSGTIGTGKTSLAAHFVNEMCRRGERSSYFAFEESRDQLFRNMQSIGIDLHTWEKKGRLQIYAQRATVFGLEAWLSNIMRMIGSFKPAAAVFDTLSIFGEIGVPPEVHAMLIRLIDYLKESAVTSMLLLQMPAESIEKQSLINMSSLSDAWIVLRDREKKSELIRELYILKSRGMDHSRGIHRFALTDDGLRISASPERKENEIS